MQARVARLFPVYLLTAVLSLSLVLFGGNIFVNGSSSQLPAFFDLPAATWIPLAISNLVIVTQDWALFAGLDSSGHLFPTSDFRSVDSPAYEYMLIPQAWTIGLELVFYAIAPRLAQWSNKALVAIVAGSLALRLVFGLAGLYSDPWSYRFFPFELSFFVAGMLAYRFKHLLVGRLPTYLPLAIVTIALLALPLTQVVRPAYALAVLSFPLVFAAFVPAVFESTKSFSIDRWVGELSYPVYLTHILVLSFFTSVGFTLGGAAAVLASLAVGAGVVLFVDRPLEAVRRRQVAGRLNRPAAPSSRR